MTKPIWEQYGISLEDYAKAFNKELDEAWNRETGNNIYLVNYASGKQRVARIANIKPPMKGI